MATDDSRRFVEWTIYVMDRYWDVARILKRADKRGDGLSDRDVARAGRILHGVNRTMSREFLKYPRYVKTIRKQIDDRIMPLLVPRDPTVISDLDETLERLVNAMVSWMIDYVVAIETGSDRE